MTSYLVLPANLCLYLVALILLLLDGSCLKLLAWDLQLHVREVERHIIPRFRCGSPAAGCAMKSSGNAVCKSLVEVEACSLSARSHALQKSLVEVETAQLAGWGGERCGKYR